MTNAVQQQPLSGGSGTPRRPISAVEIAALAAMLGIVVRAVSALTTVDLDLYHQMSLIRSAVELGHIPKEDHFSYTPTVVPVVHHEWGTGAVLYAVCMALGGPGLMALKYLISTYIFVVSILCIRRRGGSWMSIAMLVPVAVLVGANGFTTVRAQLLTLGFISTLLFLFDRDREGHRAWVIFWLPAHVLWLNLHAGFVVGMGFCALHWLEQVIRTRKAQWHLIALGVLMVPAVLINPYGLSYVTYLGHSLTMPRPYITEWVPMWREPSESILIGYFVSLLLLVYAILRLGWRRMPGLVIVLIAAYAALRHSRHASIYAIAWLCYVPGWIEMTPLADAIRSIWQRRQRVVAAACAAIAIYCVAVAIPRRPWIPYVPASLDDEKHGLPVYPVGAVNYLLENKFRGNLMTPFNSGSFVMWHLHPMVRVGLDSRYEATYQAGVMEEICRFYWGLPGWEETLRKYPTDLVLTMATDPVAKLLADKAGWGVVYRDDAYELFERPGLGLPFKDRSDTRIVGTFP